MAYKEERIYGNDLSTNVSWDLSYPEGLGKIAAVENAVKDMSQYLATLKREELERQAKEQLAKAMDTITELVNNPTFVSEVIRNGYQLDLAGIAKMITDVTGWKSDYKFLSPLRRDEFLAHIADNAKLLRQALAARNVHRDEVDAMIKAYVDSMYAKAPK